MSREEAVRDDSEVERTVKLLGGSKTLSRPIRSRLEAHDLIRDGLPAPALNHLIQEIALFRILNHEWLGQTIGVSSRAMRRHKDSPGKPLSPEQGGRTWKFAEILGRAIEIFGSKEDAETWLATPALALEQRKPIDLLSTPAGIESVEELLTRLEYGVYT